MVSVMLLLDFQSLRTSLTTRTGAPREDRAGGAGRADAATGVRPPRNAERRAEALVAAAHLAVVVIMSDVSPIGFLRKLVAHSETVMRQRVMTS
jgi:hypothetical protein